MKLKEIEKEDKEKILEIYYEYINAEKIEGIDTFEGIRNFEHLAYMKFEEWYEELENNKNKDKILKEYSTQTTYLVIENNKIIGILNARWEKVPRLMEFGGLIGYSIIPKYRGKRYANEMLKLGLQQFKNKGINEIVISCKDFNIASKRVIEKNNGIFEREFYNRENGYNYLIYTIKL